MQSDDPGQRDDEGPISDFVQTATEDPTTVTVFEHHDGDGAKVEVAVVRSRKWHLLTVEEARELANMLLVAADLAEECSQEFEVPLPCALAETLRGSSRPRTKRGRSVPSAVTGRLVGSLRG